VNLLALRTDLSGDPSFRECISRVHETALGAYSHQDVPFDKVVEDLRPKRNRAYSPLVQVMFSQRSAPRSTSTLPGIETSTFDLPCNSIMELNVSFADTPHGFAFAWVYNSDLFDAAIVSTLADRYRLILETVSVNPATRLSELSALLTRAESKIAVTHKQDGPQSAVVSENLSRAAAVDTFSFWKRT
jgi:non-ribosomal peptide synthetase component F